MFGWFGALLAGLSITDWASVAALVYTLLLIADKLKQWGVFRFIHRVWVRVVTRGYDAGS